MSLKPDEETLAEQQQKWAALDAPRRAKETALIAAIKANLPALRKLVESCKEWADEELPYRFYHQSFKVYRAQGYTNEEALPGSGWHIPHRSTRSSPSTSWATRTPSPQRKTSSGRCCLAQPAQRRSWRG